MLSTARCWKLIKEHGCKAGLVFNPATSLSYLDYVMGQTGCDPADVREPKVSAASLLFRQTLINLREVRRRIDAFRLRHSP
ncbi:hypothetical protein KCP75_18475 [Salmonella enterica subsp. enterica]|nr:hypothetical protein KCP75_18475 [Salmonella enterica subsp. enterica]